jgi:stearoyl-CoA desaturase (delta-9 desaturase)
MSLPAVPSLAASPTRSDIEPAVHETRDRIITGVVTGVPFLALGLVVWQTWSEALHWSDVVVFAVMYVLTGLGVTVGFHRYLTHRSFRTSRPMRAVLGALGSAAVEGPVISWVADHRKHHTFSDEEGDPHSPHVDRRRGWRGALGGLWHAHVGWLFLHTQRGSKERYAPDLLADPVIRWIDRTFVLWVAVGLVLPFGLGLAIGGSVNAGLTGLLWGGGVRLLVVHHVTYSINSLCHFFGRQRFATGDESRNLPWLALPSFGESWHNNHHAFPTAARHGLRWWEVDVSGATIRALERMGLVWDVIRVSPERQRSRALAVQPAKPSGRSASAQSARG